MNHIGEFSQRALSLGHRVAPAAVHRLLGKLGHALVSTFDPPPPPAPPPPPDNMIRSWEEPAFIETLAPICEKTLLERNALYELLQLAAAAARLPGNFAEFGVYRGGTAFLLARLLSAQAPDKRLFLFDTFDGMPETDAQRDIHRKGDFNDTSINEVRAFLAPFPAAVIHQGLFSDRFAEIEKERFALVHIDCDIYSSVRECCEFLYPRMVPGGVMLFDDYGVKSCPGATLAVDEFFRERREVPIRFLTSQTVVFRQAA